jgi:hypothetical protein
MLPVTVHPPVEAGGLEAGSGDCDCPSTGAAIATQRITPIDATTSGTK